VTDDTFTIALGGRQWEVPHLPFRAIVKIQPALFQLYLELGGADPAGGSFARLSEPQLNRMASAAYETIAVVDKGMSREEFFDLPFSVGELMRAFPAIAQAAGLRPAPSPLESAAAEAPQPVGEPPSIA
jgi:hypothetical protein